MHTVRDIESKGCRRFLLIPSLSFGEEPNFIGAYGGLHHVK